MAKKVSVRHKAPPLKVGTRMESWAEKGGSPSPLGVIWVEKEQAFNFALYGTYATDITLSLDTHNDTVDPPIQYRLDYQPHESGRVWHCRIPASRLQSMVSYASRVDGPRDPGHGYRCDPEKILLDPYAKTGFFPETYSRDAARSASSDARGASLGLLRVGLFVSDRQAEPRPRHTGDTIIYELHVKGVTTRTLESGGCSCSKAAAASVSVVCTVPRQGDDLYVMINTYWEPLPFVIQAGRAGEWHWVIDTGLPGPANCLKPGRGRKLRSCAHEVKARPVVVCERAHRSSGPRGRFSA